MLAQLKKALKNSAIYGVGNISTKVLGFVLIPIYMEKFPISEYGALGLLEATAQIIITLFGFSLSIGFNRWYFQQETTLEKKKLFSTIFFTLLAAIAIVISLVFNQSNFLSTLIFNTTTYAYVLKIMVICAGAEIITELFLNLLKLQERAFLFSLSSVVKLAFNLFFTIYFIVYQGQGIEGIYHAQLIGHGAYFLLMIPILFKEFKLSYRSDIIKDIFFFSLPLMLSSISILVLTQIDRYMLANMQSFSSVGEYTLGFKIANSVKVFIIFSVRMAISPMLLRVLDDPNNKRLYSKVMTYFTFGVIPICLTLSIFGKDLIELLSSNPDYINAHKVIPIITLAIIFGLLKDNAVIGLHVKKKTSVIASLTVVISILNIGLNLLLIPRFSTEGAAIATLLSQAFFFIGMYYFAQKVYKVPYELRKIILMLVIGIGIYCCSLLNLNLNSTWSVLYKLFIVSLFPVVLYFFNFYEKIELLTLKRFFLKKNI